MCSGPITLGWSHRVWTRGGAIAVSTARDHGTVTLSGAGSGWTLTLHRLKDRYTHVHGTCRSLCRLCFTIFIQGVGYTPLFRICTCTCSVMLS